MFLVLKRFVIVFIILSFALIGCSGQDYVSNTTKISPSSNNNSQLSPGDDYRNDKVTNLGSELLNNIDTTQSPFKKGYYNYEGNINGNIPIQLSIYPLGTDIIGTYFYEKQKDELELKGKASQNQIVLYEYDDKGKNTGAFQGTMETVDKIQGKWINPDGSKKYPFVLSLKTSLPGAEFGKRYAVAGVTESDQNIEDFASRIQEAIIKGDKEQLSEQISFPIMVKINGIATKLNKADFLKDYDQIINPAFKQKMSNAFTKYLFANQEGIMFGSGMYNIWFSDIKATSGNFRLMIISINN